MLFQTIEFGMFFLVLCMILKIFPVKYRNMILLVSSYFFYMSWDYRFGALILVSTAIDFYCGFKIDGADTKARKKTFLTVSIVSNLGILGFFKYSNFFIDSASHLLSAFGFQIDPIVLNIILPVGISFYTFQSMSYTIDIYREVIKPEKNFLDFALFVAFFPQLVAGPIVRAKHFLPQLRIHKKLTPDEFYLGAEQFVIGLTKKVVLADNLSPIVDLIYGNPTLFSSPYLWLGAVCFIVQIYYDFSGYSDMAIGLARILGFRLEKNFNMPFISKTPNEIWNRWHISLSTWFRDYVFFPLFQKYYKAGRFKRSMTLMIPMVLCGLWHGADVTYIIFGACHGVLLLAYRVATPAAKKINSRLRINFDGFLIILMFIFFVLASVPFRSLNTSDMLHVWSRMLFIWESTPPGFQVENINFVLIFATLATAFLSHFIAYHFRDVMGYFRRYTFARGIYLSAMLFVIINWHYQGTTPFLYFQF